MNELWRAVPGFEGLYEVSSQGRVRSLYFSPPRICALGKDSNDYPTVMLSKDGRRRPFTVHRLVCRAFHGEPFSIWNEAAHLNGNRTDARAVNLRWVNKVENHFHQRGHGTHMAGEKHPRAILSARDVARIRTRYARSRVIASDYGISPHTVRDIWRGKRWKDDSASGTDRPNDTTEAA